MTSPEVPAELIQFIAQQLSLKTSQVASTIQLLDDGNTVPFITRYRKGATGGLDEEEIRGIERLLRTQRELISERQRMLDVLAEQGKLTPQLEAALRAAETRQRLDELFAPYRSQRKTRADEARARGLAPLADRIWSGRCRDADLQAIASSCVGMHPDLTSTDVVLQGALDLLAERLAEDLSIRDLVRRQAWKTGRCVARLKKNTPEKEREIFADYNGFEQSLTKLPPHRILALDRGEARKALNVSVQWDYELAQLRAAGTLNLVRHPAREFLHQALGESLKRLVNPSIEREIRKTLTARAHEHAIGIFTRNLRQLLLQPPLWGKTVLAIDPGFRSGCKVAVLGVSGELLEHGVVDIIPPERLPQSSLRLAELVRKHSVEVISVGNGTASREAQELVAQAIQEHQLDCQYVVVNEAGASIYSASAAGREEFPDLDATVRGTISIGRRLQDPLSELVKIEPQHLGVGMYQHDLPEKLLEKSLGEVVESCVNHVGVELNQASAELLRYVSGLNRTAASAIVEHRRAHGPFRTRQQLLDVAGIGQRTFIQAAGFLRIRDGDEPLDATWVHPESYPLARELVRRWGIQPDELRTGKVHADSEDKFETDVSVVGGGEPVDPLTLQQVRQALLRPGRDPREDLSPPLLRKDVVSLEELRPGMQLAGVVTNVVDFGAFVDIGLKNDGLVHISKMADEFIASPLDRVSVGETVSVWVESVDPNRQRVGLSLIPLTY